MHKKELVIAAYDKPLEWLTQVPNDVKISVYRKGTKSNIESEIFLEKNIGRCVHTFFNHIANNYDSLSEWTYFAQDFPFDHWSDLIESLSGDQNYLENNCAIYYKEYFGFETKYIHSLDHHKKINSSVVGLGNILICDKNGYPHHGGLPLTDVWNYLFDENVQNFFEFNPGGHFCASKCHLLKRSKIFYERIVNLLEGNDNSLNLNIELVPYCIERLENYIFNDRFKTIL